MFSVQVEGLDEFLADLRALGQTEAQRYMLAELRPFAAEVAGEVRNRAQRHVQGAVRVGSRSGVPAIIVDGTKAPDNRLWEFSGRHPVFGNEEVWVYQEARPYIGPAIDSKAAKAPEVVERGLMKALDAAGWN